MPRPLKYDWTDKRDICYKLFVEQRLTASKIVEHFTKHFDLPESEIPTSRDFRRQFRKWGFIQEHEKSTEEWEGQLKERMTELFAQNIPANQVQDTLIEEGWGPIDKHKLRKLRSKFGLMYRTLGGAYKEHDQRPNPREKKKRKRTAEDEGDEDADKDAENEPDVATAVQAEAPQLPPEEQARRAQRAVDLQIQSDQLMQTGKRRRRIRGMGPLPPDAAGTAPRYQSETSLDECKAYLHLTNDLYLQIRSEYDAICREMGITKMSLCKEGEWQASKDRLIRDNQHLSYVLHPLQPDIDKRLNALNCICSDVTKRIRDMGKRMTIPMANNILGLDPMRSKEIRRILYEILEEDQFTTVFTEGKEHFAELQQQWYAKSPFLQQVLAENDPVKNRAVFMLCKDARKRYCDDTLKKNPTLRPNQKQDYGPGPGPATSQSRVGKELNVKDNNTGATRAASSNENTGTTADASGQPKLGVLPASKQARMQTLIPVGPAWEGHEVPRHRMSTLFDLQPEIDFDLDPLLTRNIHGPPWPPPMAGTTEVEAPSSSKGQSGSQSRSIAAYFRLGPGSQIVGNHPRMWLGKLANASMVELKKAAASKAGAARVTKVNGIAKNADGGEDSWLIENDDELEVYLGEAGEKATFVVVLEGGYA